MFGKLKKRRNIPFQNFEEITISLEVVSGGCSCGSTPTYPQPNGQPITQVDPIQVGPTG